jgi:hypothetical protein
MEDWFGETPVEMQESLPSHYYDWVYFCSFCDKESIVAYEGKHLCERHADEILEELGQ